MILATAENTQSIASLITNKDFLIFLGVFLTALGSYLGTRATGKSQETKARIDTAAPNWSSFVDKIESSYQKQIDDLKERHEELIHELEEKHSRALEEIKHHYEMETSLMEDRVETLETEVRSIREELEHYSSKYRAAISYIRETHRKIPDVIEKIDIPEEIQPDI